MSARIESELLRANAAFYEAFVARDIEAMDALWARDTAVACTHPGWPALHGREDVMWSWRAILLGGGAPRVHCEGARAFTVGETGLVLCTEWVGSDPLAATNVFVRQDGLWHLVHHHASPVTRVHPTRPPGGRLN